MRQPRGERNIPRFRIHRNLEIHAAALTELYLYAS